MGLMSAGSFAEPVTVWHFLCEDAADGTGVYHAAVYEAAVVCAEQAKEVQRQRHGVAEMRGFLFPTGHLVPVTPMVGRDCIARGDCSDCETPTQAQAAGAQVYCFSEVIRPPRLSGGTLVEWVQFTANALV